MSQPCCTLSCRWCDAVISAPCELGEIPTVVVQFEVAGWRWIDGWATCPECSAAKQEAA